MAKKLRTPEDIRAELDAELEQYRTNVQDMTQAEQDAHKEKRSALFVELSNALSAGANPCKCGNDTYAPMGMVKTPSYMDRGVEVPTVYEVGCVHCPPFLVEREDGYDVVFSDGRTGRYKRRSFSARAYSVEQAVENWNSGKWVEDNLFNRNIPGVSDSASQDENGVWHLP